MIFAYLLALVPASLRLAYVVRAPPLWGFAAAVLAIVPLAAWIRSRGYSAAVCTRCWRSRSSI